MAGDEDDMADRWDVESRGDRRKNFRFTTLLRVGVIEVGARRELCLIRNISAGGLMAEVFSDFPEEVEGMVELKSGNQVHGKITWVNGRQIGFTFDEPTDVRELLTSPESGRHGPRVRLPRIAVASQALLRSPTGLKGVRVIDISQGGLKIVGRVSHGETVQVSMDGLPPLRGVVRWCDGNLAGIAFLGLIPFRQLVSWANDHQSEPEALLEAEPLRDSA